MLSISLNVRIAGQPFGGEFVPGPWDTPHVILLDIMFTNLIHVDNATRGRAQSCNSSTGALRFPTKPHLSNPIILAFRTVTSQAIQYHHILDVVPKFGQAVFIRGPEM